MCIPHIRGPASIRGFTVLKKLNLGQQKLNQKNMQNAKPKQTHKNYT